MTNYECVHCGYPVHTETDYGYGGTYWTHEDGYESCPTSTFASPNLP